MQLQKFILLISGRFFPTNMLIAFHISRRCKRKFSPMDMNEESKYNLKFEI